MEKPIQVTIIAGGRGERMGKATRAIPKPMLVLGGKPLLEHQILWLKSWGFNEIFLCLGYKADNVRDYFSDGKKWGVSLRYHVEQSPRGTAGAVRDLLPSLTADDLLVVYGDLYIAMDLSKFLKFYRERAAAASLVVIASDHPLDSDLVRLEGDRITEFYRAKPGEPYENVSCAAVWAVRRSFLKFIPEQGSSDFGRDIFPQALAAGEKLMAYRTDETLADLGTPQRWEQFTRRFSAA